MRTPQVGSLGSVTSYSAPDASAVESEFLRAEIPDIQPSVGSFLDTDSGEGSSRETLAELLSLFEESQKRRGRVRKRTGILSRAHETYTRVAQGLDEATTPGHLLDREV